MENKQLAYKSLASSLKRKIHTGLLGPGDKLPSQRVLAAEYGVSRNTVMNALLDLAKEGLIQTIQSSRPVVALKTEKAAGFSWGHYLRHSKHISSYIKQDTHTKKKIDISRLGLGDDYREIEDIIEPVRFLKEKIGNFTPLKRDVRGELSLREALCSHLKNEGINATPKQVLIVSGAAQAYSFLGEAFLGAGSSLYYEKHSDINYFQNFSFYGANMLPLKMDSDGVTPSNFSNVRNKYYNKIITLSSVMQAPTSISMSETRKKLILNISNALRMPIIDNCNLAYHCINDKKSKPLKAYNLSGNVIHIGAIPKSMVPGIWLGWIVSDERVIDKLVDIKDQRFRATDPLNQKLMEYSLRNGYVSKYIEEVKKITRERSLHINEILEHYLKDIACWSREDSGYFYWLLFKEPIDTKKLYTKCKTVSFNPGVLYNPKDRSHICITPSQLSIDKFEEGIKLLTDTLRNIYPQLF